MVLVYERLVGEGAAVQAGRMSQTQLELCWRHHPLKEYYLQWPDPQGEMLQLRAFQIS